MPRVRFTAAFDWKPKPQITIAYPEGFEGLVTRSCAEKAIKQQKAVRISDGNLRKDNRTGKASAKVEPDATGGEERNSEGA
ncbi:hypothetical protein ACI0FR_01532 [Paenochrobactrum sp. BZR 201-1]